VLWPVLRWLFTVFKWKPCFLFLQTQFSWLALSDLFYYYYSSNNYYIAFLRCLAVFDKSIITRFLFVSLCPSFKGWIRLSQVHRALWDLNNNPIQSQRSWIASRQFFPPFCLILFASMSLCAKKEVFRTGLWAHSAKKIKLRHLILVRFFSTSHGPSYCSAKIAFGYEKFRRFYIMDFIKSIL